MISISLIILSTLLQFTASFTLMPSNKGSVNSVTSTNMDRQDFLSTAVTAGIVSSTIIMPTQSASARGRATLEYALDRYYPRIEAGGVFYANDLRKAIEKSDWKTIKVNEIIIFSG